MTIPKHTHVPLVAVPVGSPALVTLLEVALALPCLPADGQEAAVRVRASLRAGGPFVGIAVGDLIALYGPVAGVFTDPDLLDEVAERLGRSRRERVGAVAVLHCLRDLTVELKASLRACAGALGLEPPPAGRLAW